MTTVRTKKNKNYTTISNIVLNDVALTWKAKGLAAYLLSKPDDWRISREHLAKQSEDGISAVRSALQELEKFGYLVREKSRNEHGKIEWEYVLLEEPQNREPLKEKGGVRKKKGAKPLADFQPMVPSADFPPVEKSPVENPPVEKSPVENRTLLNTDQPMTDQPITESSSRARGQPTIKPQNDDDDEPSKEMDEPTQILETLTTALGRAGVTTNQSLIDQYLELVANYGLDAVLAGIQTAVANGKQERFNYVAACVTNAANGTRPTHKDSGNGDGAGFGLTAYAEKERARNERDFGPEEPVSAEKEQWIWEQKRKLAAKQSDQGV